jgi:hypothetical protein
MRSGFAQNMKWYAALVEPSEFECGMGRQGKDRMRRTSRVSFENYRPVGLPGYLSRQRGSRFFAVEFGERFHGKSRSIVLAKRTASFSEQFGVMGNSCGRKAIQVVEVTRMVTVDHGFRLSGKQLFD